MWWVGVAFSYLILLGKDSDRKRRGNQKDGSVTNTNWFLLPPVNRDFYPPTHLPGASLVAQWQRIHLQYRRPPAMQEMWV